MIFGYRGLGVILVSGIFFLVYSVQSVQGVSWTKIAAEGQSFTVTGTQTVRFGGGTQWIQRQVTGRGTCSNSFFGRDPLPFQAKECFVAGGSGVAASSERDVTVSFKAVDASISYNSRALLKWSSKNATSCKTPWGVKGPNGKHETGRLTEDKKYTITCTGAAGSASDTARVQVGKKPDPKPTVRLTASAQRVFSGETTVLSWSSSRATACSTSWGATGLTGGYTTPELTTSTAYSVTCTGKGGSKTALLTITVADPATALTLSGPTGGVTGVASTQFTVGANGAISGAVAITPSATDGFFTPVSVSISNGSPSATFTYTPGAAGEKSILLTSDSELTSPAAWTYTASATPGPGGEDVAATAITLTGPSTGTVEVSSSNFTVGANGTISGTIVVTPSAGDGSFNPATVTISSASPTATFTYSAGSVGVKSLTLSNDAGLSNPAAWGYTAALAAIADGSVVQFLTHDGDNVGNVSGSSAPTRSVWNLVLGFPWKRGTYGDWLDANQNPFGTSTAGAVPYATFAVPAPGVYSPTVTSLVSRWLTTGENRGFYLRMKNNAFNVRFAGRADADPAKRPKLIVTTSDGVFTLDARCNATWNISTFANISSSSRFELTTNQPAIVQFDLSGVTGNLISAELRLTDTFHLTGSTMDRGVVDIFEADPPRFAVPNTVENPVLGIAATLPNFQALATHPDVLFSDDLELPGWSDNGFEFPAVRKVDAETGTTYATAYFDPSQRLAANFRKDVAVGIDPFGTPSAVYDDLYGQYWFRLGDNFGSTIDSIKIPGMSVQWGYWTNTGYWQNTTGNGGTPPTGLKVFNNTQQKWEYQGSSLRLLVGQVNTDQSAYSGLFAMALYPYNLDQGGPFPPGENFPYVAIQKGKKYWLDIHVKQNSVAGTQDANGNYSQAIHDGEYEVWLNGYPAYSKKTFRWRYHLEHGVQGIWVDWFHGGTQNPPYRMDFDMGAATLATEYIGPPAP